MNTIKKLLNFLIFFRLIILTASAMQSIPTDAPMPVQPDAQQVQPAQQPTPPPAAPVMPTLPDTQQAPQALPVAAPSPAPMQAGAPQIAPAQQPAQVPAQQATPTPAVPQAQTTMSKQDLDQIAKTITSIKTIKSSLQDQLKDIDEKIYEARMLDAQAKKLHFTILDAENDAQAHKILSQMQEASKKVQLLEEMIKGSMAKGVDDSIAKIQDHMKTLEDLVKKLEAQGASFQTQQLAALDEPVSKIPEKKALAVSQQAMPVTTAQTPEIPESKSFIGRLGDICSNIIGGVIKTVRNIFSFFKPAPILSTEPAHTEAQHTQTPQKVISSSTQPSTESHEVKKEAPVMPATPEA